MSGPIIYLTVRDRVTPLMELVVWLERAGADRIVLLDNDSTYPPLLEYLSKTPHEVVYLRRNLGPRALWIAGMAPDEPFVVSDPDILPLEDCPLDAIAVLAQSLEQRPWFTKAGLGLYLDDVPEDMPSLNWERRLVGPDLQIAPGVFSSLVDTTFALYRAGASFTFKSIRLGWPYQARHLSWYTREPTAEDHYYLERARRGPDGSSWAEQLDEVGAEW